MKTELEKLKARLDKAVVFEVGTDMSIGISTDDDLWRIRRDINDGCVFLNKAGIWESPPNEENIGFATRTGYDLIDDAFGAAELYMGNYDDCADLIFDIANTPHTLTN
jgi:hypothetical protein